MPCWGVLPGLEASALRSSPLSSQSSLQQLEYYLLLPILPIASQLAEQKAAVSRQHLLLSTQNPSFAWQAPQQPCAWCRGDYRTTKRTRKASQRRLHRCWPRLCTRQTRSCGMLRALADTQATRRTVSLTSRFHSAPCMLLGLVILPCSEEALLCQQAALSFCILPAPCRRYLPLPRDSVW